jgi:predicted hotdog family 3-hydroxylacyl-ACP dehydratase
VLIGREELCGLIPHAGEMCLLDGVIAWDEERILCCSSNHLKMNNPLCCAEGLSALQGIEHGAQAMAVHGGLLVRAQGSSVPPGYLVALRNVELQVEWLDRIDEPLNIEAVRLLSGQGSFMYEFKVSDSRRVLLSGRATVMAQGAAA